MRIRSRIIILACLFLFFAISGKAEKKAFLVCIGEYAEDTGWEKISAINDLHLMETTLTPGFYIESISNQEATHKGVTSFLNGIVHKVSQRDTVLILFSCHGQQMLTVNDKNEPDGLDEAIIPYDARQMYSEHYRGENHLRDDDIADVLYQIRYAIGDTGLLLVLFDACHSDSMYKGGKRKVRGSSDIFGPPLGPSIADSLKKIKYAQDTVSIGNFPGASEAVYVSACRATQRNKEVIINEVGYGSLTYAFATAYKTYGGLMDISSTLSFIQDWMRKNAQQPVFHTSFPVDIMTANSSDSNNGIGVPFSRISPWIIVCIIVLVLILCLCLMQQIKRIH